MEVIQILLLVFAAFAFSRVFLRLRDGTISKIQFIFWGLVWSFLIFLAVFPNYLNSVSNIAGIGRAVDVLVYIGIAGLFYLVFRIYVYLDKFNQNITDLTREVSYINKRISNKNKP